MLGNRSLQITQSGWWSNSALMDEARESGELNRKHPSGQQICCLHGSWTTLNSVDTKTALSVSTETVRQPRVLFCPALGVLQPPDNESRPLYDPPPNHSESKHKGRCQGVLRVGTSWAFFLFVSGTESHFAKHQAAAVWMSCWRRFIILLLLTLRRMP